VTITRGGGAMRMHNQFVGVATMVGIVVEVG